MKVSDLTPHPGNPRKISDVQLGILKRTYDLYGDLSGIVFNINTKRLVGGHQRVKIIPPDAEITIEKRYDPPTKKGTVAEGFIEIDGERFRYREVAFSEETERAANIAANKAGGDWDNPKLAEWLLDLDAKGWDTELTGWSEKEVEDLCAPFKPEVKGNCPDDEAPPVPVSPKVRLGDSYRLGEHKIMCGDSTSAGDVAKLMGGEVAAMIFTDPPYGVDYEGVNNDHLKGDRLRDFLASALRALDCSLKAGGCFYIWHPDIHAYEFIGAVRDVGWQLARPAIIQWLKNSLVMSQGDYHSRNEPCLYGWKPGAGHKRVEDRTQDTIWECDKPSRNDTHPTMKPVALAERALVNSSENSWLIADLFLGSGSTLIACEKTGRKCYGMEIDPQYCDVILDRWANFTGKDPVREDGAKWSEIKAI